MLSQPLAATSHWSVPLGLVDDALLELELELGPGRK